jgi:hypothetical protein
MNTHGLSSYTNNHCRCEVCTVAMRVYQRARRTRANAQRVLIDGRPTHANAVHGTDSGYANWRCRCIACTEAHRLADRARVGLPVAA